MPSRYGHNWFHFQNQIYGPSSPMTKEPLKLFGKAYKKSSEILVLGQLSNYAVFFVKELIVSICFKEHNGSWCVFQLILFGFDDR